MKEGNWCIELIISNDDPIKIIFIFRGGVRCFKVEGNGRVPPHLGFGLLSRLRRLDAICMALGHGLNDIPTGHSGEAQGES